MVLLWFLSLSVFPVPPSRGETNQLKGIQPLLPHAPDSLKKLLAPDIRPLLDPHEQEGFLQSLEGQPPNWKTLHHADLTIQSDRLWEFNRHRDRLRLARPEILQESLAFLWSGILRNYSSEYQGYTVALGPNFTSTSWGIVRFKPTEIPDFLIAIPSDELRHEIDMKKKKNEPIEIQVLFIGKLVQDESIMYTFSHEDPEQGLILPVVSIEAMKYILPTNSAKPLPSVR